MRGESPSGKGRPAGGVGRERGSWASVTGSGVVGGDGSGERPKLGAYHGAELLKGCSMWSVGKLEIA